MSAISDTSVNMECANTALERDEQTGDLDSQESKVNQLGIRVLCPMGSDHNDAFYIDSHPHPFRAAETDKKRMWFNMTGQQNLLHFLESVGPDQKIGALEFDYHGAPSQMADFRVSELGELTPAERGEELSKVEGNKLITLLKTYLAAESTIILNACSTGGGENSLAAAFSRAFPDSDIYASQVPIRPAGTSFRLEPNGKLCPAFVEEYSQSDCTTRFRNGTAEAAVSEADLRAEEEARYAALLAAYGDDSE